MGYLYLLFLLPIKNIQLGPGPLQLAPLCPSVPLLGATGPGGVQMSGGERLLAPAAVSSAHLAAAGAVGGAAAAQRLAPSVSCIVRSSTRFLVVTDAAAGAAAAGDGAGDVVVDSVSFIETTVLVGQLSSSSLLLSDCSRRRSSLGFVDGCARGALYLSCSRALFTCICSHPHQCSSTPLGVLCDCSRLISSRSIKACS